MVTKTRLLLLALALSACHAPAPQGLPPSARARRVVLLSLDGLAAQRHQAMLARGAYRHPQGLAAFAKQGWCAARAIPPNPTLTSVSHATIATGALPQEHGIVANRFHLPGTPLGATVSGFDAPWEAEPLWAVLRRQGKKAGVVTFPGCDGTTPQRTAEFFMVYVNEPWARPRLLELPAPEGQAELEVTLAQRGQEHEVRFSLPLWRGAGSWQWEGVEVADAGGNRQVVRPGEWFPLAVSLPHPDGGSRTVGAWCLLQAVQQQPLAVRLYQGGFYALEASPRAFRELLEKQAGFWPGPPDDRALEATLAGKPGLSLEAYYQQLQRFSRFFTAATLATVQHMEFQLLLAYQPIVDEAEHALLVADQRQPGYTPELAATAEAFLHRVYLLADQAVGELAEALDLQRDALVVVSDHGMQPVWAQLAIPRLLADLGLCPPGETRNTLDPSCRIWAVPGGGVAHLYVNLAPADPFGLAQAKAREELLLQLTEALARLEAAGEPAIEAVIPRERAAPYGLAHPASGDCIVFPKPGVALGGAPQDPLWSAPPVPGMHGFLNHHPSMAAVFMARGAGLPRTVLPEAQLTQVAPLVLQLLASPAREQ